MGVDVRRFCAYWNLSALKQTNVVRSLWDGVWRAAGWGRSAIEMICSWIGDIYFRSIQTDAIAT
jgi:hypothetical protein